MNLHQRDLVREDFRRMKNRPTNNPTEHARPTTTAEQRLEQRRQYYANAPFGPLVSESRRPGGGRARTGGVVVSGRYAPPPPEHNAFAAPSRAAM